jgi:FlaA1/EpsC-like NDP-sugar epimerase
MAVHMKENQPLASISYENVLGREIRTVPFGENEIQKLRNERILITGAGGSIGSRIALALSKIGGIDFLVTDRDESALHSLSLKLTSTALFEGSDFLLLDIRDPTGAQKVAEEYAPTVIIHAAALKHLSVLEKQPREALLTNVYGTLNMLEIAQRIGVKKFVNISTDKAASPVSVLGRSKFLAELLAANYKINYGLDFRSVRFGNVFGSRGSVIETFVDQIQRGMPITVTHADVKRYFMHADEAAFLTIKSFLLSGGDLFLFDMGESVRIVDLINSLQKLLGSRSNIVYTGLRDGEKLTEDLFDGVEKRTSVVPDLIERGEHRESVYKHAPLIQAALGRKDYSLIQYLEGGSLPKI